MTTCCKSVLIAVAVAERHWSVQDAIAAARLEEDYQIEDWGMVEAGHDLDIVDINTRVGAPAMMLRLLTHQHQQE